MAAKRKITLEGLKLYEGLGALKNGNQNKVDFSSVKVAESADIDTDFQASEPNANRWDYYIGIQRLGEFYLEVHKVNEDELTRIINKATWLKQKIADHNWPYTDNRNFFVAPTAGIPLAPAALFGNLSRRLALEKISVIRKGDNLSSLL